MKGNSFFNQCRQEGLDSAHWKIKILIKDLNVFWQKVEIFKNVGLESCKRIFFLGVRLNVEYYFPAVLKLPPLQCLTIN